MRTRAWGRAGLVGLVGLVVSGVITAALPGAVAGPEDDVDLGHPDVVRVRVAGSGDPFANVSYGGNYRADGVANAGDVNHDGIDDTIVGAPGENGHQGAAYVIYGGSLDAADLTLAGLGSRGFRIAESVPEDPPVGGSDAKDLTGWSVAGAGDVNGDGIDDVVIGAPNDTFDAPGDTFQNKDQNGSVWIVYGQDTADLADVDLDALGARGMHLWGGDSGTRAGTSVAGLGAFNAGDVDDVAIGAAGYYGVAGTGQKNGAAIVVYGEDTADPADLELPRWQVASSRVMVALGESNGFGGGLGTGNMVAGVGNFDRDANLRGELAVGVASYDYYVAGPPADARSAVGAVYVVHGANAVDPADFSLPLSNAGGSQDSRALRIIGDTNYGAFGYEIEGNVDLTGDDAVDLVISAPSYSYAGRQYAGAAYVVYGLVATEPGDIDVRGGYFGYRVINPSASTEPMSIASGDVSGDGVDDAIIGLRDADRFGRTDSGTVYVVDGQTTATEQVDLALGPNPRVHEITGATAGDKAGRWVGLDHDGHVVTIAAGGGYLYYVGHAAEAPPPDTTPPVAIIDSGGGTSSDPTPTFTFHANETATFECSVDQGTPSFAPCSGPGDTHTPASPLAVGSYTFRVRATDTALNLGPTATVLFAVSPPDTTAPETSISSGGGVTRDRTPTFAFTSNDPAATFTCSLDRGTPAFAPCSGPGGTHTPSGNLVDGTWTFRVRATDAASNVDPTPATRNVVIDARTPQTTITRKPARTVRLKRGRSRIAVGFAFRSSEGSSTFVCSLDGRVARCTPPKTYQLGAGAHTFTVAAVDRAGNRDASPARFTVTVKRPLPS